jgi:hypothetical protein
MSNHAIHVAVHVTLFLKCFLSLPQTALLSAEVKKTNGSVRENVLVQLKHTIDAFRQTHFNRNGWKV